MSNDAGHFLRKVAKFVTNPTTDWTELDAPATDTPESEYAKAEIKAMIERKRRNDFVRKRELDMLRKIRREGLNHDSALALTTPSNLDSRTSSGSGSHHSGIRSDIAVKAKIDEIEQQMVGSGEGRGDTRSGYGGQAASAAPAVAPTPAHRDEVRLNLNFLHNTPPVAAAAPTAPAAERGQAFSYPEATKPGDSLPSMPVLSMMVPTGFQNPYAIDVSEVVHDPELDEAVMAFANADFEQCERTLLALIQPGGTRHNHSESWMVLFDLYRALDMPGKFDGLATWFAHQFGLSAPQWYSLPERVSQHLGHQAPKPAADSSPVSAEEIARAVAPDAPLEGWIAPALLDAEAVGRLRCEVLQLPRPWVMDWTGIERITAEGANQLTALIKAWSDEPIALTWIGVDPLLAVLTELSPTGDRDADPAMWMLRMELLRQSNRPDHFDETAIDYCVTYELSPPSWEPSQCTVKLMRDATCTQTLSLSHIGEVSTSFVESQLLDDTEFVQLATLELAGQLTGDIGTILTELDAQLGASVIVSLDCSHLIRIDFIAAGDLLNWVLSRRAENRSVDFVNPHRLIALFLGAMGITEHAKVKLQLT
jgi:ABC-type transporter Mla MlaB component